MADPSNQYEEVNEKRGDCVLFTSRFTVIDFKSMRLKIKSFGKYQIRLLLITQAAYISITGSVLCSIFDAYVPKVIECSQLAYANISAALTNTSVLNYGHYCQCPNSSLTVHFYSLILDLNSICVHKYLPTTMTTVVMAGGVVGAMVFGFAADRYGRKTTCMISLTGCCISNLVLLFSSYHWVLVLMVLFVIGFFAGGYMVVNYVLLTESVSTEWRLFCSCFIGWAFGMMAMALMGFVLARWRTYHMCLAFFAFGFMLLFHFFVNESPRWLSVHCENDQYGGEISSTDKCIKPVEASPSNSSGDNEEISDNSQSKILLTRDSEQEGSMENNNCYSYIDLVRDRAVFCRLMALTYCWLAASVISFGLYFNMGSMAGNIFLNIFLSGLVKGTSGIIPFFVEKWFGRKQILVFFVCISCIICWMMVVRCFVSSSSSTDITLTIFAIIGVSVIDPMWKINQLYSTELFPTVVRNMARGVCNIGSRTGSLVAPQIAYLSNVYFPVPFIIYGCLAMGYLLVSIFLLPETKGKSLEDRLIRNKAKNKIAHC